jgi:hypothetical protein
MAMLWTAIRSMTSLLTSWLRVISEGRRIMFGSFPDVRCAFGGDDLPLSFVLRRDSHRRREVNGKRHNPIPALALHGIDNVSKLHLANRRPHVRSALCGMGDRRKSYRDV